MIRALVADDQALVRAGVRVLLQTAADVELLGECATGQEAVEAAGRLRPDVVLMDIRMPGLDGIEATRQLMAVAPATKVVMLTTFADEGNVYDAFAAGAIGFLVKDGEPDAMLDAVRRAAAGEGVFAPSVLAGVLERARISHQSERSAGGHRPDDLLARLTPRERAVLTLVGSGCSNLEIADQLGLGVTTVKTHIVALLDKLTIRNRVQAAVLAHRLGLVDDRFVPVTPCVPDPKVG